MTSPSKSVETATTSSDGDHVLLPRAIDPRRQSDEARSRALARLLETAAQPYFGAGADGRLTCTNIAFAALVGISSPTLLGVPLVDLISPRGRDSVTQAFASERPFRLEVELLAKNGRACAVELAVELDRDLKGKTAGFCVFVTDQSDRKAVEKALRVSGERFRRLYNDAPVGYRELDTEGRFVNINTTGCELLGFHRDGLIGRSPFELFEGETRGDSHQAYLDRVSGRAPLRPHDWSITSRDGRKLVLLVRGTFQARRGRGGSSACLERCLT